MGLIEISLLSVALAMDAFVVSFAHGLVICKKRLYNSLLMAFFFGLFQAFMPIMGYFAAQTVSSVIDSFSRYLVFAIFLILGIKFILESFEKEKNTRQILCFAYLLMLAVATSIDAFVAGISLFFVSENIFLCALLIGCITFGLSVAGFWFACSIKKLNTQFLEITAGIILIVLAVKSLF